MNESVTDEVKVHTTDFLLSPLQIAHLKYKAADTWKQMILKDNPDAELFGGAIRDEVMSRSRQKRFPPEDEFSLDTHIVPKDLDFRVRSLTAFNKLRQYMNDKFGIEPKESKYEGENCIVYTVRIPLITHCYFNRAFTVDVDLVWEKSSMNLDFDVNSLYYTSENVLRTSLALWIDNPVANHIHINEILKHIEEQRAFMIDQKTDNGDDSENEAEETRFEILGRRACKLMDNHWTIVQGSFEYISKLGGRCGCAEHDPYTTKLYGAITSTKGLCCECLTKELVKNAQIAK